MSYLNNSITERKFLTVRPSLCLISFSFLYAVTLRLAGSVIKLCKYLTYAF
jgi:hypothetical protein